jgi:hypothetical protein
MSVTVTFINDSEFAVFEPLFEKYAVKITRKSDELTPPAASKLHLLNEKKIAIGRAVFEQQNRLGADLSAFFSENTINEYSKKQQLAIRAIEEIRKNGIEPSFIDDPVEWQREIRKDRALPFRD